ncbi:methyltransferase-like protein 27 [Chaetodon auriga]|uniref:methyltransferase-like protein 27 n=1 Tax=Chaetodon auriga TaxID=39042 RepID=UPI004032CDC7
MSLSTRTIQDVGNVLTSRRECEQEKLTAFFDKWAEDYEKDCNMLDYQGPNLAAALISSNFSGNREAALVLDVACGPGQLPKLMYEMGFRHFVGIDYSQGMLDEAAKTGLYEELKPVKLGAAPLPVQAGTVDVVAMVGALQPDLVPFSVLRELCQVTKPGGLICVTKAQHRTDPQGFTGAVEREFKILEDEGLWHRVDVKTSDQYIRDEWEPSESLAQNFHIQQFNNAEVDGDGDGTDELMKIVTMRVGITSDPACAKIVLEGTEVLTEVDIPRACALLRRLIYALNLSYPQQLKNTFKVFLKIFLELDDLKTSPKV